MILLLIIKSRLSHLFAVYSCDLVTTYCIRRVARLPADRSSSEMCPGAEWDEGTKRKAANNVHHEVENHHVNIYFFK